MNNVEADISQQERARNETLVQALASNVSTAISEVTTEIPNATFVPEILKNASIALAPLRSSEDSSFFIYIWAIGIVACILLTTGR